MSVLPFVISGLLLIGTAWQIAKQTKIRSLAVLCLLLILVPMAELVFIAQVLNLFGMLGSIAGYFWVQVALLAGSFWAARKWGNPIRLKSLLAEARSALGDFFSEPSLAIWFVLTTGFYLFNVVITFVVPPNNNDALSTHIARVGFWLRHGNLAAWETDRWYQLIYPLNAQLVLYWQALFLRSDVLFGSLQWLSAVGAGLAVYALSRQLTFSRKAAAYAALSMLAFPVVLFQSTTTQNDLVMSMAVLTAALFALRAAQNRSIADLGIFVLAAGFAFGIKQTFFFFAPVLILLGTWAVINTRRVISKRGWAAFFAFTALIFLLFGVNKYIENYRAYANVFGPPQVLAIQTNRQSSEELPLKLIVNTYRAVYGAIDPAGLPDPLFGYFHKIRAAVFNTLPIRSVMESPDYLAPDKVFRVDTVYPANEDTAQFGPAYLFLLLTALGVAGKRTFQRDHFALYALIGAAAGYFLLILMRPGWDEFQARYMIPIVGLLLPYWGVAMQKTREPWRLAFVALAALCIYSCSFYNPAKPVLGKDAANLNIWTADRVTLMMAQNRSLAGSVRLIENNVPATAAIGVYASHDYHFQYPLFGAGFTRDVVPIIDEARLTDEPWLAANDLNYLLLRVRDGDNFTRPPAAYFKLDAMEGWRLYQRLP